MTLAETVTLEELDEHPHPVLARLRACDPVAWLPALGGWLVTSHVLALEVMRDAKAFTVDDPRFSTAQVIGPSMLSLDGPVHDVHRAVFVGPFRPGPVRERFEAEVRGEAERLIDGFETAGTAELRTEFAGPLAAGVIAVALGLERTEVRSVLGWYREIVAAVSEITAGQSDGERGRVAFGQLSARLSGALRGSSLLGHAAAGELTREQVISNAAVLLFGGIETTEGMLANLLWHVLTEGYRGPLDAAIEESLRLEPAAAVVDRYAAVDRLLGDVRIRQGDLVRVSISGANRDPEVFAAPDRFDAARPNARRHLTFAQGPHVCLGVHLARLEARIGVALLLQRLPDLRLDPARAAGPRGLVFRKPPSLWAQWDG